MFIPVGMGSAPARPGESGSQGRRPVEGQQSLQKLGLEHQTWALCDVYLTNKKIKGWDLNTHSDDVSRWKKQHLTDRRRVTFFQVCELFQMDVWVLCMFWYLHTCTNHVKYVLRIYSNQLDGDIGEWIQDMNLNRDFSNTFSRRVIDILEISLPFGSLT